MWGRRRQLLAGCAISFKASAVGKGSNETPLARGLRMVDGLQVDQQVISKADEAVLPTRLRLRT